MRRLFCYTVFLCGGAGCGLTAGSEQCSECAEGDCPASCGRSCEEAIPIGLDTVRNGTTLGAENVLDTYCTDTPSGPDVYYRVVAPYAGRFRVRLSASEPLMLVVMDRCEDEAVACAGPAPAELSGTLRAGEERYVVVSGKRPDSAGAFTLSFEPSLCGNGVRDDEDEACDGQDVGGLTCADFEFAAGSLGCTSNCRIDIKQCRGGY